MQESGLQEEESNHHGTTIDSRFNTIEAGSGCRKQKNNKNTIWLCDLEGRVQFWPAPLFVHVYDQNEKKNKEQHGLRC